MTYATDTDPGRVCHALRSHARDYDRYLHLLEAQRVAVRREDWVLLRRLDVQVRGVLADIQKLATRLAPVVAGLRTGHPEPTSSTELSHRLVRAVAARAASAERGARHLTQDLLALRDVAGAELATAGMGEPAPAPAGGRGRSAGRPYPAPNVGMAVALTDRVG